MEEVTSFLSHVFGALLFCLAITLLLYIKEIENATYEKITTSPIESAITNSIEMKTINP